MKQNMSKEFFDRLSRTIYDADMFDAEIERRCDFTKGTIFNYKTGRNSPSLNNLMKLCQLLNVSADYLLFGKESD